MTYREPHDYAAEGGVPGFWWHLPDQDIIEELTSAQPYPPSPWESLVLAHIERHLVTEENAGRAYEEFADVEDPQVRYLAGMLAADEHRHHQMLSEIARSLQARVDEKVDRSVTARSVIVTPARQAALLEQVRRLLAIEEDDAGELKKLHRDLHEAPPGTIWPLLVEIMELDTDKHIRILRAVEEHLVHERWPR